MIKRLFITLMIVLIVIVYLAGCSSNPQAKSSEDIYINIGTEPIELRTANYTITIKSYSHPIPNSDSNEAGEFLSEEDVIRGEVEFK